MDAVGFKTFVLEQFERRFAELLNEQIGPCPPPGAAHDDWVITRELIREAVGDRFMSPGHFLFHCQGCHKIRTNRMVALGPCKCGSLRITTTVPRIKTEDLADILKSGY